MDPQACLQRFIDALAEKDTDEARDAHADLIEWIERGGFEPLWEGISREEFFAFDKS